MLNSTVIGSAAQDSVVLAPMVKCAAADAKLELDTLFTTVLVPITVKEIVNEFVEVSSLWHPAVRQHFVIDAIEPRWERAVFSVRQGTSFQPHVSVSTPPASTVLSAEVYSSVAT